MQSASVSDALSAAEDALRAAGCDTPRLDAELLLAHAMGVDRKALFRDSNGGVPPAATRRAIVDHRCAYRQAACGP